MRTDLRVSAQLAIDDRLVARLSQLSCAGDGAIASIACGILEPQLRKLEDRSFDLLALPMGEAVLRDVRMAANGDIKVSAEFGSGPAATA